MLWTSECSVRFSLLFCVGILLSKKRKDLLRHQHSPRTKRRHRKKHAQEFRNKHRNKETKSSNNNTPTTTTTATTYLRSTSMAWKSNRQRERKPSQPPTTTTTNTTTTAIQEPRKNESKSTCQPSQMRTCNSSHRAFSLTFGWAIALCHFRRWSFLKRRPGPARITSTDIGACWRETLCRF